MKNIVKSIALVAATGLISINAMGQQANDVPQTVQTAFSAKYPQAQLKDWKDQKNTYMAYFGMDNKKYEAAYSKDGNWLFTERDISNTKGLPTDARLYLKTTTYASWHIDDMKRVRTPMQNTYQVTVDNHSGMPTDYQGVGGAEDRMLSFNDNGKLVKVTPEN